MMEKCSVPVVLVRADICGGEINISLRFWGCFFGLVASCKLQATSYKLQASPRVAAPNKFAHLHICIPFVIRHSLFAITQNAAHKVSAHLHICTSAHLYSHLKFAICHSPFVIASPPKKNRPIPGAVFNLLRKLSACFELAMAFSITEVNE